MSCELPFVIQVHAVDNRRRCNFVALRDGRELEVAFYRIGDISERTKTAKLWCRNPQLRDNGKVLTEEDIGVALAAAEAGARGDIERTLNRDDESDEVECIEAASYVDDDFIAELAWNGKCGQPDFIVYNRGSRTVERHNTVEITGGRLIPPKVWRGILTPGVPIPGSIYLPSEYDELGLDESQLRADLLRFINAYVELPRDAAELCVTYILLSWIYDSFAELPYASFRTGDIGRGKSRALLTVGILTYRPMLAGGGSTAAALRRILDIYRGTLVCDEFDVAKDTELACTITKILNQGFEAGRPMILCDGESNTPRPFHVFGPKLMVLRGKLGDDASESRLLSFRMAQRTRRDIPISLPRQKFYGDALRLRDQLLAWRFNRLGKVSVDASLIDTRLEDCCRRSGNAGIRRFGGGMLGRCMIDACG